MLDVIDVGTSQRNLNFDEARRLGNVSAYVKLGGDNVGRYVAPYYVSEVDAARRAGLRVGHYWVPNAGYDPVGAADYFVDHLRGWTAADYVVLDNESLDGAHRYSDAQAAAWINRVKARLRIPGKQTKHYSGLADARGTAWPQVLGTGTQFIIAAYSYAPFALPAIATVPADRIDGHQYSSSGNIGGVTVDLNVFRDTAFDYAGTAGEGYTPLEEEEMKFRIVNPTDPGDNAIYALSEVGAWVKIANTGDLKLLQKFLAQGTIEDLTKGQITIIRQYLKALYPQPAAPVVDVVALADALAAKLPAVTGGLSREQLIEAVEAAVEDVPTQTVDELSRRTTD